LTNGWSNRIAHGSSIFARTSSFFLLTFTGTFFVAPFSPAQAPGEAPTGNIRVDVARVNVGVIVTDPRNNFVKGLRREDFHLFDNGTEQPITNFASIEEPAQVLLLVEAGPGVYFLADVHIFAADAFLQGLSPEDRVALARYADVPTAILDYTPDKSQAQAALDTIQFNLGFAELNLSSSLNQVLDWLSSVPGKKSIVLLSTGIDMSPQPAIERLQSRLAAGEVRIICISMTGPLRNGKEGSRRQVLQNQQTFDAADAYLRTLADATGGRAFFPNSAKAVQESYRQVAQLIRNEYSLAFAPPDADGAYHLIDAKVDLPALPRTRPSAKNPPATYRIDHRKGYVAPKAP
jgi:Ca-activated chloride channel family protein